MRKLFTAMAVLMATAIAVLAGRMFTFGGIEATLLTIVSAISGAATYWMAREAYDLYWEEADRDE